ncbi:hypothetical protein A2755_01780 [Candidatus Wolfebacteria bacterium RIFCSPHIGHO2_01_FULL_48_22]|uniref:Uncharacterized protein n=2 Tax=Candidatus Wolfeibacteriota TaxID=1752735 RepID=A0A1F8DQK9_9BACT|nr:MAG: hypothetical protein A2755_01780 [Candidatus Wolfebacteria bacterium RIFCSPHIGHO2_01_FULL_48_22]OGM91964.1 MAG: hypothetical protein A2935_02420 [Candidatus Wolfebacteria bacterium RIFCSPLOWO2_01_FULL_47_17b]
MTFTKNLKQLLSPSKIQWTSHAKFKMAFYGLSESRVRRVLNTPLRVEEGIAERTGACMQPASYKFKDGKKSWSQEIWVMFTESSARHPELDSESKLRIISAWRYPGVTKPRAPLPESILAEIDEGLKS